MGRTAFDRKDSEMFLAVAVFLALLYLFSQYVDPAAMKALVLGWGVYGPLAIIFLQVVFAILAPLPNSIPVIVAGSLYGTVYGAFYAAIGTIIGAVICYFLAVRLGRKFIEKIISKKHLAIVDLFFKRHGFESVLVARLLPVMSFDAVSYGAGLVGMDFWKFMAATVLGMIPGTLLYAFIGDSLSFQWLLVVMAAIVVVSAIALPFSGGLADSISGRDKKKGTRRPAG